MSGKIWCKFAMLTLSLGTMGGVLSCLNLKRIGSFSVDHAVYDTFLSGIINGLLGGLAGA